ncbi:acylneuraminate cytidylyltransferase family protein [Marinobacter koreensis]|jgi:pseudaminic acid cytidylyltransferase|uniref:Acylneuraminate cytidylyltransferase family protein n=1 Tax=Marinobacter koreensis TaxID=335974 RepID=A0ABW0RI31_9GAMM|nr:acylneuraminate cytidylyltransferase family protein [Marinobacter koreensis]MCK7547004.1 acylneuraminate cytidylyltransferase family protein [Marinobacter koreensis]
MRVAIIPARGGSKRLPGKNLKPLAGKPVIQWSIDAALESGIFDRVCVSTDSEEIAELAQLGGAEVPFLRPAELATDTATTADVVRDFIHRYEALKHEIAESVCLLQPTSPLRTVNDIREAAKLLLEEEVDAVVSVCEMEHPYQLCGPLGPSGSLQGFVKAAENIRSQDQETFYRLNGAIYFCSREAALKLEMLYEPCFTSRAYIMSPWHSVDIDTKMDFRIAEALIDCI